MATWRQVQKVAAELGANIEHEEGSGDLYAYSPRGTMWKSEGCSTLVEPYANVITGQSWKPKAYAVLLGRIVDGVENADPGYEGWWVDADE
jgi:hypothetical protein